LHQTRTISNQTALLAFHWRLIHRWYAQCGNAFEDYLSIGKQQRGRQNVKRFRPRLLRRLDCAGNLIGCRKPGRS
jgi:hypothetical protein